MYQYRIEIYENNEETGVAASKPILTRYADNHEDARLICEEFANQIWETNGWKKYTVQLYILSYKKVAKDAYFSQYQA